MPADCASVRKPSSLGSKRASHFHYPYEPRRPSGERERKCVPFGSRTSDDIGTDTANIVQDAQCEMIRMFPSVGRKPSGIAGRGARFDLRLREGRDDGIGTGCAIGTVLGRVTDANGSF